MGKVACRSNVIITISLSIDNALYSTIDSIVDSGAYLFFDVLIKLGTKPADRVLSELSKYCSKSGLSFCILSDPDDGIYDAMNQAIVFARPRYDGYLWFVNAGDRCNDGINFFSDYLYADSCKNSNNYLLIGGVNVFSEASVFIYKYIYKGLPSAWFKPPLHSSILFPNIYWRSADFKVNFKVAADMEYIYKALRRDFQTVSTADVISSFYLGGLSSRRRSFSSAIRLALQRTIINFSTIPFPYFFLVSITDVIRIIYRSKFSKL